MVWEKNFINFQSNKFRQTFNDSQEKLPPIQSVKTPQQNSIKLIKTHKTNKNFPWENMSDIYMKNTNKTLAKNYQRLVEKYVELY